MKKRNGGQWTEARFRSFITSALRQATQRWQPKNECLKKARVRRGWYKCNGCKKVVPASTFTTLKNGKRKKVKNALADHIKPIVDPKKGFVDWNTWIERAFIEEKGYQCLCYECHTKKTNKEKEIAKRRKK